MSLYEGLGEDPSANPKEGAKMLDSKDGDNWKSGLKLLQTHIQLKKATMQQRDKPKTPGLSSPVEVNTKRKTESTKVVRKTVLVDTLPPLSFMPPKDSVSNAEEWHVTDEYNPLYPNDYERLVRQREEEKLIKYAQKRQKAPNELGRVRYPVSAEEEWDNETVEEAREREKRSMGAAIAPPPNLIEEDRHSSEEQVTPAPVTPLAEGGPPTGKGLNVAARIMERYGYKHGSGLGKSEQGMSTPLLVEKTGLRGGKIIHERDIPKETPAVLAMPAQAASAAAQEQPPFGESITEILKNPSKVMLLKNMVGPGEVDDELEPEVKEEMQKYGDVAKCIIYELPGSADNEAVRIFVEFAKVDQAIKAVVALNGRYFGGRVIQASFYDVDKFHNFQLMD